MNAPVRQIVLDTETTGLEPELGHRVIEIGGVELIGRRLTGRTFHQYLDPQRDIDDAAIEVHGIVRADLAGKPLFRDVVDEFLDFVDGAEVVIHNAPFDVAFIDYELSLLSGYGTLADRCTITDSLAYARRKHPGQKNSLDALCRRYGVDNSQRTRHGALLDAEILADVYLAMTGGQTALSLGEQDDGAAASATGIIRLPADRPRLKVVRASLDEIAAHEARLDRLEQSGARALFRVLAEGETTQIQ